MLSPGQASDIAHAQPLLDQVRIPGKSGRPRKRCRWLLADKGYDAEHLRQYCDRYRMQPVIPQRTLKRKPKPGLPRLFDRPKYRQRNIIERMFGWLKENIRLPHTVPAASQPDNAFSDMLPEVLDYLYRPLPIQLSDWVMEFSPTKPPPQPSELRAWLTGVNKQHSTRLTLGRVSRYLEHWCLNHGVDRAIIALTRGESCRSRPALSYFHLQQHTAAEHYYHFVHTIFSLADQEPGLPGLACKNKNLGSRLFLPTGTLHNLFQVLASPLMQKTDILSFHNHYVCYVWALLTFSTGHRDVTAPMGRLSDYNPYQRTWWISDKERRHGLAARTLVIPPTAAKQVDDYLQHLRQLQTHCRFLAPELAERCQQALDGSSNLLFVLVDKQDHKVPVDLRPALLADLLQHRLPWARNWARHHLRSELAKKGVNPELIDGWMGQEEIGEEALGRHSFLSMSECRELADMIESILNEHQIEALPGWSTH